jgi:glutaredoxin 3
MITIYTKENCIYCTRAKTLMKSREIPFVEEKLDVDFTIEEFATSFPGHRTFPLIMKDGHTIGGYVELVEAVSTDPHFGKMILNEGI